MAVIKSKANSATLQALTAAALLLPNLFATAAADESDVDFQYSRYVEGPRQLAGVTSKFSPIEVDTVHGGAKLTLADRVKFAFNYTQDTWSGATPITTAPRVFGGNTTERSIDGVSGATPIINPNGNIFVDTQFNPLNYNPLTNQYRKTTQLVHTLSSASPETRQQGDFKLGYEWDEAALDVGGGISVERDYESRFVNLGGRWDFNQKLTSVNAGVSYTNSTTSAKLDHDASPYIEKNAFFNNHVAAINGSNVLGGGREDWAGHLGVTQILNKNALVSLGAGYTRGSGYMANPYKVTEILFVDPNQLTDPLRDANLPTNVFTGDVHAFLEQRPTVRNQWNFNTRYVQYLDDLNAALHLDYRFYHDDWGINGHTLELNWGQAIGDDWLVTPKVRYYSQTAANFYQPYVLSKQAYQKVAFDNNGVPIFNADGTIKTTLYNPNILPEHFSSDQRLSGYGAISGGLTISKKFAKGVTLETAFEYYSHQGGLKLGGNGEGKYADFDYYTVNAALKVNLSALATASSAEHNHHAQHANHNHAPAGVMFDHTLNKTGEIMVGYRYMRSEQGGDTLHGASVVGSDNAIRNNACAKQRCEVTPAAHTMQMHMMDIMYAPTDWLTLMLMPQFMSMEMNFRQLSGAAFNPHSGHGHETGGVGDTGMYALFALFDDSIHHLHIGIGLSAPTGDVGIKLRPTHQENTGFIHYGMQLGSGTWDFKPSITYTGRLDAWSWGAQLNSTHRLDTPNKSGFAFGDVFQSTVWGSYNLVDWLSASVRGVYSTQGAIKGSYNEPHDQSSALDYSANYGGQYWDVGLGLNATVTGGEFIGNRLAFEWLQPVADKVNGYQLDRTGALSATWGYAF